MIFDRTPKGQVWLQRANQAKLSGKRTLLTNNSLESLHISLQTPTGQIRPLGRLNLSGFRQRAYAVSWRTPFFVEEILIQYNWKQSNNKLLAQKNTHIFGGLQ